MISTASTGGLLFTLLILFLISWRVAYSLGRRKGLTTIEALPRGAEVESDSQRLMQLANNCEEFFQNSAQAKDMLGHPPFRAGVSHLRGRQYDVDALCAYVAGDNAVIATMAARALWVRRDGQNVTDALVKLIGSIGGWALYFVLDYIAERNPPDRAVVGRVLVGGTPYAHWVGGPSLLAEFVKRRRNCGETPSFGDELEQLSEDARPNLVRLLNGMPEADRRPLLEQLARWTAEKIDIDFLRSIGTIWTSPEENDADEILAHPVLIEMVSEMEKSIQDENRRSIVVTGETGVGKSVLIRSLGRSLQGQDWTIFESSASEIIAGMKYVGEIEGQILKLIQQLKRAPKLLWVVHDFHALAHAGRHSGSAMSLLDTILPHVESGEIAFVGECQPSPLQRIVAEKRRLGSLLSIVRVDPMREKDALGLGRAWMEKHVEGEVDEAVLAEAWQLAQQYLGHRAAPGNLMELLELTRERTQGGESIPPARMKAGDLVLTLASMTGLPAQLLDDRRSLDLSELSDLFGRRVIGQPEATDALVERVAMMKAGLTDPTRPFGVFLFAGPTGTGKTEIAKTLAEFLFGSAERMIRLDMSELQAVEDLDRLLGSADRDQGEQSLVARVEKQPFSIILLDEFEKAHERIWDLFLQVFDDGRLTDRVGNTADFRYTIIILTSNLGAAIPSGERLGFAGGSEVFTPGTVLRSIENAFRPEFLNRLDKVVVFRPLDRETMRRILRIELDRVFERRGLRTREWAVEWDPAAIEFLLEKGFTPALGARPLKRAVDKYLLVPLALSIVGHEVPEGDQFLYVTVGEDALDVQFVDMGGGSGEVAATVDGDDAVAEISLKRLAYRPIGGAREIACLRAEYDRLRRFVEGEDWAERKRLSLEFMELPEFWESEERAEILGSVEYQGRIEAVVRRTGSLLDRLGHTGGSAPTRIVQSVAHNLYLLGEALADVQEARPREAFLLVEAGLESGMPDERSNEFARELAAMYRGWIERRRMQAEVLLEIEGSDRLRYRLLLAVEGFGAHSILAPDCGTHLMEFPAPGARSFERISATVLVVEQGDFRGSGARYVDFAEGRLSALSNARSRIVRRYRRDPSPLVRDSVRGWRSGRIDHVLRGDFDLIEDCRD